MTDMKHMSADEQRGWWQTQAENALDELGLSGASVQWFAYTHNAVFQIEHQSTRTILRLQQPETRDRLRSEIRLVKALHNHGLAVPQVLGVYESVSCVGVHLSFLEGETYKPHAIHEEAMQRIGHFLGALHTIPMRFAGDDHLPHLDWLGLFGQGDLYDPGAEKAQIITDEQQRIMDAVAQRVRYAMNELHQDGGEFGLLHGDFLLHNILFYQEEVRAVDFEYAGWGYYLYDLAPVLWQLKPLPTYPALEAALWRGYTAVRPLTQRHHDLLETFIAGRQVASMRWVAANQYNPAYVDKSSAILVQRARELEGFLHTGMLNRS